MSAKAAPKTFHQLRNVFCLGSLWYGLTTGYKERTHNDDAWRTFRFAEWKKQHDAKEAAHEAAHPPHHGAGGIPSIVPAELHEVYKSVSAGH